MEESLNKIAQAIMGLYSDPINHVFPSVISFSSTIFGAFAAFYVFNTQERNRIYIQNVDSLNEAILSANDAKNSLMAIKSNYHNNLRKVRTSIPRTKNENFSHLISMGYQ